MIVFPFVTTERLTIQPLALDDDQFIFELVNTDGWHYFIGNRHIQSLEAARAYIQKISDNSSITYWVVRLKQQQHPIGIITFIQRSYLDHPDIGFAILPAYSKRGYAYEAATAVLQQIIQHKNFTHILATTVPGNTDSIKLLQKLGLHFIKELVVENTQLQLYGAAIDTL